MFEDNEAKLQELNDALTTLENDLSPDQKVKLDTVLKLSSDIFVSEVLKREFDYAFESGAARMVLQYVNGKFVVRMIK